ncbi:hypothetical protein GH714_037647 [Hevea brasiliensis]|uniref:Nudix hydrolase domain-containing protein n=1 Tax=Hevea brasiliensis TaxID=3981 RepID=A0A6A6KQC4_HEVBR|nr:hypothetical protein GH714_037647 [Hevea brasiliensis]
MLFPSVFRAIVSLHPASSIDPDAVAFFSAYEGGADEWEDLRFAAMREIREETAVTSAEFLQRFLIKFTGKEGGRDQPIGRWIFKDWSWMLPE